ncbi:hypothetical protein A9P82_08680 [Arachidicoccus ginsenosidimutans]|uniref:DUF1015 domain-containing protein n=1 Tax=Arachidicoccus sp. BS20 TaxID=1850526 RepID=UPI0007F08623|nr:DUF1015 family protein [Arachidicoccus sp. BS20]ANI89359.1 hypothetical protein A9P82_08680 [Arachidicoccus sp. BS20]
MAIIKPFRALRPAQSFAKQVASRPYDVLNREEAKEEANENTASFLHITKSEIDLDNDVDIHSPEVYEKAKANLQAFIDNHILFQDEKPCYYIYRLIMNGRSQTGLVAASSIDDYDNDVIKKHEFTRPEKEQDRINHITTTGAQTGNVFLAYRNNSSIDEIISQWKNNHAPEYDFTADDNIQHTIWIIDDEAVIKNITDIFREEIPNTYIADGHHRAASAAKVRQALGGKKTPDADYFLTTLFPANELQILDYNRVIKDLNGLNEDELLEKLQGKFTVEKREFAFKPAQLHSFGMYLNEHWYKLISKENTYTNDPIGVLDVTILQENILSPVFNIQDQRTDERIDFVGGIRGLQELERRVDSGEMAIAFSLFPVSIEQLFDIADSGNVMPPKSTWFEPKLRDGLLTHLII